MKNKGLFSTLYIEDVRRSVTLTDQAAGRMATLGQTWRTRDSNSRDSVWDSFLKQAVSYLEFVPPTPPTKPGIYPLFEDWGYSQCVSILYLVEPGVDIDDTSIGRFAPAKLIAELQRRKLNWGIITDGSLWRLYSLKTSRPYEDYVELPLSAALEENDEAEYGLFEFFFHRDSFVPETDDEDDEKSIDEAAGVYKCRLDINREESENILEEKVKKPFLYQIDEVLQYLCNGFIQDTPRKGEEYTEEERSEIFQSSVKLLYRCLFLFYAESRRLLPSDPEKKLAYQSHSMAALCERAHEFRWGIRNNNMEYDLWKHFQGLINAVNDGDPEYGIMGYDGGLFDDKEEKYLGEHRLRNDFLSRALYLMAFVEPPSSEKEDEYKIPYEDLEVRHLGELYENILEFTVQLADADRIRRRTRNGVETLLASQTQRKTGDSYIKKGDVYFGESALERKQTGSYYTPESLVKFLNKKTIVQPLSEKFESEHRKRFDELLKQAEESDDSGLRRGAIQGATSLVETFVDDELLKFTVCDPAMGSGHFLVDAANQMTGLILSLLEEIPFIDGIETENNSHPNYWRRQITRHCLYGVDLNPLAVHLSRLSLWLNSFASDHRLTFLDHHLKCGNSLIGIRSVKQLSTIPKRKKDSKKDADKYKDLFPDYGAFSALMESVAGKSHTISQLDEDETDEQKSLLDEIKSEIKLITIMADLYTAYLMDPDIDTAEYYIQFKRISDIDVSDIGSSIDKHRLLKLAGKYKKYHHHFHWPMEFPDIFVNNEESGFSATVGNPPWDIVKPNSQEFFSFYDPKFRSYKKQEANRVSQSLLSDNPKIASKWKQYTEGFSEQSSYFKEPASYSSLGKGDINTYKLFLEKFYTSLKSGGHLGIIVPSGLYTDQGCQPLRELFFDHSSIKFLYCFENHNAIFNIHRSFKIVLFGLENKGNTDKFRCAFMEREPDRLPIIEANAMNMKIEHVRKYSPSSVSIMEFKSQRDIDITATIYKDWPLLGDNVSDSWNVKFKRELDMTNDSHLFKPISKSRSESSNGAYDIKFRSELHMTNDSHLFMSSPTDCPLYEGKMISLYNSHFEQPRYWLDREEVKESLGDNAWEGNCYRLGFRSIGRNTDVRTLICSIIPKAYHGNSVPTISPFSNTWRGPNECETLWLCSILSSLCIDYIIRQKVSANINFFYVESLPVPRNNVSDNIIQPVVARAARLLCYSDIFDELWSAVYNAKWKISEYWYPDKSSIMSYGPSHEQQIRDDIYNESKDLNSEWHANCSVNDRLPDMTDTGNRAQLRAEIDAYIAHLYGITKDDFAYILDTFPGLKNKEQRAFGEYMSKRKCLEEYDRIEKILREG